MCISEQYFRLSGTAISSCVHWLLCRWRLGNLQESTSFTTADTSTISMGVSIEDGLVRDEKHELQSNGMVVSLNKETPI